MSNAIAANRFGKTESLMTAQIFEIAKGMFDKGSSINAVHKYLCHIGFYIKRSKVRELRNAK